jgi:hypothetical protein
MHTHETKDKLLKRDFDSQSAGPEYIPPLGEFRKVSGVLGFVVMKIIRPFPRGRDIHLFMKPHSKTLR